MRTFVTPEPIAAVIDIWQGDIRIVAGNNAETTVDVRPTNLSRPADVKAAEQIRVEFSTGRLLVQSPKDWKRYSFFGSGGAVDVLVDLPAGSEVRSTAGMGAFDAEGRLGDCGIKTGMGNVRVEDTAGLEVATGHGEVSAGTVAGALDARTGSGDLRIAAVHGAAQLKNSNGAIRLGTAAGEVRAKAANGDITVDAALGSVTAKSSNGNVRINGVISGVMVLQTALGEIEVGIAEGTAAWLDATSSHGRVRNSLDTRGGPEESGETVQVQAHTSYGDIIIRRAT